ncbi:hypothetical protein ACHQM5_002376 [Ranunculus cassubicifolius]
MDAPPSSQNMSYGEHISKRKEEKGHLYACCRSCYESYCCDSTICSSANWLVR